MVIDHCSYPNLLEIEDYADHGQLQGTNIHPLVGPTEKEHGKLASFNKSIWNVTDSVSESHNVLIFQVACRGQMFSIGLVALLTRFSSHQESRVSVSRGRS